MQFKIKNTRTNYIFMVEDYKIEKNFECESFYNKYGFCDENADTITKTRYLTDMVEYETWCSPRGIEPMYKVMRVIA